MRSPTRLGSDDRGVSIAITHVLTIGITTVFIAGLLIGAASLLDHQREASTDATLETIGERLANEISKADRVGDGNVTVVTDHQRQVTGSGYAVALHDAGADACIDEPLVSDDQPCLVLESHGEELVVAVPLDERVEVADGQSPVTGGNIEIVAENGEISLQRGGS